MKKLGTFAGIIATTCLCFYAVSVFFIDVHCKWGANISCEEILQAQALDGEEKGLEENFIILDAVNNSVLLQDSEIVSQHIKNKQEEFSQKQTEAEYKTQQESEYQAQLLQEGKIIVSDYEAQRQKNISTENK